MRYISSYRPQRGAGIGGLFRPIIRFFKSFLFPSAKLAVKKIAPLAKRALKSNVGRQSTKALREASVGLVADAIAGTGNRESATNHINTARKKVATALLKTSSNQKKKRSGDVLKRAYTKKNKKSFFI